MLTTTHVSISPIQWGNPGSPSGDRSENPIGPNYLKGDIRNAQ